MPVKVKSRAPAQTRLAGHRPIRRGNGLPIIAKIALVAAVVALSAGVLYVGSKGLGSVVGGLGSTVGGFVGSVTATSTPEPSIATVSDPPSLVQPTEPYTTEPTVDLVVTVPAALVGDTTQRIRVFLALADQKEAPIEEVPLSDGPKTIIPVELTKGINDFSVTIKGPGGESEHSAVVRYVLDTSPPKLTITSPKNGAIVNRKAVTITGKTQARTTLVARNAANGSSIAGTAESDGGFSLSLAMSNGSNAITITATDPAGNVSEAKLSDKRGTGELSVALSASTYQIKQAKLPEPVTMTATVADPDGRALADTPVTFTISMPGIPTITQDATTDARGKASFKTTIPKGADVGQGSATVLVSSTDFGSTEDYTVITITE
jgi:hypothetical protein